MFDTSEQSILSSHLQNAHVAAQVSVKAGNFLHSSGVIVLHGPVSLQINEVEFSEIWNMYHP